jgi:adenosylhomocysteinase
VLETLGETDRDGLVRLDEALARMQRGIGDLRDGDRQRPRPSHGALPRQDGAIVANSGHFNVELDGSAPQAGEGHPRSRPFVEEVMLESGKRVYVLGEGRRIPRGRRGHPASVMDMSFANQALGIVPALTRRSSSRRSAQFQALDEDIARLKLEAPRVHRHADAGQVAYLASWEHGT